MLGSLGRLSHRRNNTEEPHRCKQPQGSQAFSSPSVTLIGHFLSTPLALNGLRKEGGRHYRLWDTCGGFTQEAGVCERGQEGQGEKMLTFFWPLSWWEGCFSCWVDGEADLLLRPAIKLLLLPPPAPPPPPPAPPLLPPPPLECRDVFCREN